MLAHRSRLILSLWLALTALPASAANAAEDVREEGGRSEQSAAGERNPDKAQDAASDTENSRPDTDNSSRDGQTDTDSERFDPSEEISKDLSVSFPVDI